MADCMKGSQTMSAGQGSSASGSDSSNSSEEDRLKRLFNSCDADGDGYLDGEDFVYMCKQLNLEDSVLEIQQEFGMSDNTRMSFSDFLRCRARVLTSVQEGEDSDTSGVHTHPANITSWPTMSSDSLGAHSGKPESADYDSGARDLSPEPVSLTLLMQSHDPLAVRQLQDSSSAKVLDLADRLHLAAITSMKGELNELKTRLTHVTRERDMLDRQVTLTQGDSLCSQREVESRVEQVAARYEERIIELHSVIAELRKKVERHQINVIREEDELDESDAAQSNRSQDGGSNHDNLADANSASIDMGNELSLELSRVVTEMESAMAKHTPLASQLSHQAADLGSHTAQHHKAHPTTAQEDSGLEEKTDPSDAGPDQPASPVCERDPAGVGRSGPGGPCDKGDVLAHRDAELAHLKAQLLSLRTERDTLHKRVWELQTVGQRVESAGSAGHSSPSKSFSQSPGFTTHHRLTEGESVPVAKVAGLKKLRTLTSDKHVLGAQVSSLGLPSTQTAEHLVQSVQASSSAQEMAHSLTSDTASTADLDLRVAEYRLELDRVQSRADHLRAQNDVLAITLTESKAHAERLSTLVGKYESNCTALTLALNYSDQALEASQALIGLLDSEISVLLANCRAAGIGGFGLDGGEDEQGEVTALLQQSHGSRRAAETSARHLLHRLDRTHSSHHTPCSLRPWDDLTSLSHTNSTASSTDSGGGEGEVSKLEEHRLRDWMLELRSQRSAVRGTVMELEPVHLDPLAAGGDATLPLMDVSRLDLENAVLVQELMAIKEERAELKAAHYLLEKESRAQELRLAAHESTEQAYRVTVQHLRCELDQRQHNTHLQQTGSDNSPITVADLGSHDPADLANDLAAALTRERSLKSRVHELVATLEKISRNSELRHKQSAEFVNDLKRANSALITAFDKAKKRYQGKLKKLELQLKSVSQHYETQMRAMKERLSMVEDERWRPPPNETSL